MRASKNNTTHEQAEKLIELGIDVSTATMHFHRMPDMGLLDGPMYTWDVFPKFNPDKHFNEAKRPCWDLATLFDMLPGCIDIPVNDEDETTHTVSSLLNIGKSRITYEHYDPYQDMNIADMQCYGDTFFDCVYNMVCWLLENNLLKYETD